MTRPTDRCRAPPQSVSSLRPASQPPLCYRRNPGLRHGRSLLPWFPPPCPPPPRQQQRRQCPSPQRKVPPIVPTFPTPTTCSRSPPATPPSTSFFTKALP